MNKKIVFSTSNYVSATINSDVMVRLFETNKVKVAEKFRNARRGKRQVVEVIRK